VRRGQVRIVEALIMLAMLVVILSASLRAYKVPAGGDIRELEKIGVSALAFLDQEGLLDRSVINREWGVFKVGLKSLLPPDVEFIAVFYNVTLSGNMTFSLTRISPPIKSATYVQAGGTRETVTVEYLFTPVSEEEGAVFTPVLVRLTLVRGVSVE